jgi:4-amino-4-deoxy-L-arabinose transferase-like glycosyltransferase
MISERTYPDRADSRAQGLTISLNGYWDRMGLGLILALAAVLNFYDLSREGYANTYYAAAVKSMLQNWHAFFFNSLDSAGFVTLDKPPLGFWLQVASAKLFGYNGVALMLPQALAGVLSVALLYYLVARIFGKPAGLIAALALAITPISVVVNRNNTIDSTLVLAVLLGTWTVSRAVETGKLRWLLLCAVFVGLGFNIKMLQAYLVLPDFGLMYLLGTRIDWKKRIINLVLAAVVLLVVSLSWVTAVDLTPASQRPWVGSTTNNSALSLALGYNGLERLTGNSSVGVGGVGENGPTSVLRLLDAQLGGQIGWLLPLAVIGFAVAAWQTRQHRWPLTAQQSALILWGMWLLTMDVFFDIAGFYHTYYLVMVAPAIAALSGIGVVSLWRAYRVQGSKTWWLLPASLLAVAAVQAHLLSDYSAWARWLDPLILGLAILSALALTVLRLRPMIGVPPKIAILVIGLAALLAAPAAWSVDSVYAANSGNLPTAGPAASSGSGRFAFGGGRGSFRPPNGRFSPPGGRSGSGPRAFGPSGAPGGRFGTPSGRPGVPSGGFQARGSGGNQVNKTLLTYLETHQGNATYLFATTNVHTASAYIIASGKAVMALGGFTGSDPILTATQLATLAKEGKVTYFLLSGGGTGGPGASSSLMTWIQQHAKPITVGGTQLYEYMG